ncbi:MAG: hypothetical protein RLZZ628_27 [Bacteroidota bacterium]
MKQRSYKKGNPHRDCRLFVIVAEGEREDEYFSFFNEQNQRIQVKIVPREANASAPKHFLERLDKFKEKGEWIENQGDMLWFVLDVDRWKREHLEDLIHATQISKQWHIAISNPSFEVWLLYHLCSEINVNETNLKNLLHQKVSTGYNRDTFCTKIAQAMENAKNADTHPNQIFPNIMQTKVYLLALEMLSVLKI